MSLTLYDEFAGWGGSSQGATAVPGVELVLAANHSEIAVRVHAENFPEADHFKGDVTKADLTRFPRADLFWASPACPPFSNARGEKQYFDKATQDALFEDPYESAEERAKRLDLVKRRALMEEVPRYLRAMADRGEPVLAGVVENVTQARKWDQWQPWIRSIRTAGPGYRTRLIALDAMHAQAVRTRRAPQSRPRLFLAYWLTTLGRDPDWDKWLRPRAYCPICDELVDAVQVFKDPGVDMGAYGVKTGQYVYRCPRAHGAWRRSVRPGLVEPFVLPAAEAIDWTLPAGPKIGDRVGGKGRPKPLKPKTLARVEGALRRFGGRPVTLEVGGHTFERRPGVRSWPVDRPLTTLTTTATRALAVPPLLVPTTARSGLTAYTPDRPLRTQTTRQDTALVIPPFITTLRGGGSRETARGVDEPLTTFSAQGTHHALVGPPRSELLIPYYGNGTPRRVSEPVGTFSTRDRWALVGVPDEPGQLDVELPAVSECTLRMLTSAEIAAGMAFAPDFRYLGTQRERVAGLGNAVCPPAAEVIVSALVEAITGTDLEHGHLR
jgi:DNA (cytosine-5)-methyltransferase 1